MTQKRRFPIIPGVQRYPPLARHHSALFDETLRRSWRDSPPYMARLSALLDTTLRLTCIKVRRRVVESTAESCLEYGGELERRGRRVVQTSIYRSHDLLRATSRPPWRFRWTDRTTSVDRPGPTRWTDPASSVDRTCHLGGPTTAFRLTDIADSVDRVCPPSGDPPAVLFGVRYPTIGSRHFVIANPGLPSAVATAVRFLL